MYFVQAQNNIATTATAVTVNIASTANNLLVGYCAQNVNNTSTVTMSDSGGSNTWSQRGSYVGQTAQRAAMFYTISGGAVTTVTCTWSGSISGRVVMIVYEFSGADMGLQDQNASTQTGTGVATLQSAPLTTTYATTVILYGIAMTTATSQDDHNTAGLATTFPTNTIAQGRMDVGCYAASATQSGATSTTSWTTSTNVSGLITAFRSASAGVTHCTTAPGGSPRKRVNVVSTGK
jgi:hypothetical protein